MNRNRNLQAAGSGGYVTVPQEALEYLYPEGEQEAQGEALNLREIWSAIYRNRWIIIGVTASCIAIALSFAMLAAPVYQAAVKIQIDQQAAKVMDSQEQDPNASTAEVDRYLQTQVDVIKSRTLALRVADSLNLANDPAFLALNGKTAAENAAINPKKRRDSAVGVLSEGLSIDLPRNSRVVTINFESTNPALATKIANSFAENTIKSNLQRRFDTSAYSREFLQEQLALTKQRLENSERQVIAYARQAGLIDANAGIASVGNAATAAPNSLTASSLVQINQALSTAQANRIQAQQRWASASGTRAMDLPEVLANPTIQKLTERRADLEASYNEERQRRKEEHPIALQAAARLKELDRQINTIATGIKNSIREQYLVAARQEEGFQGSVGNLKGATLNEQDRSVQYNILKRQADTDRQMYDGLLQRFRELSAAAGITSNNISIVDRAEVPTSPVWPRPIINVLLGVLVGIGLSILIILLREKLDDRIRSVEDVERKLNLPLLGTIPVVKKGLSPQEALEDPRSAVSESHYALRMSLELSSDQGLPSTLLLTSSRQGEGKSTSAYAIARDLAAAGKKVLLIDADLRKPSLHRIMAAENRAGLANLLARQKNLHDVVQPTAFPNLFFISSGPLPPNPAQLLAGKGITDLIAQLQPVFDVVVIDGPPVLGLADAPRLADAVEGTLFVIEANGAHYGHAKSALKRLMQSRVNLLGVILTKFDARKAGYKSDYGNYYYQYGSPDTARIDAA